MSNQESFKSISFLRSHIEKTMGFYHPKCIDPAGGFYHYYYDNGTLFNQTSRHLVSSTRFVFNYAMAAVEFDQPTYLQHVRSGLAFIENVHKSDETGGYLWELEDGQATDSTHHCYGLAFVMLANAVALKAGVEEAGITIERVWHFLETHYWLPEHKAYLDEYDGTMNKVSDYRGQNANMHMCEALLMCFEATMDRRYLNRAYLLANKFCIELTDNKLGLIWEHYLDNWLPDWQYNIENPKHLFRPWGFQPGHQTEWAKLLLILYRHQPEAWMIDKAKTLFDKAMNLAWDKEHGGLVYGIGLDGNVCDGDKYFWVQAESFAAAAMLALETKDVVYWQWYEKLWQYAWQYMIDHQHGAWFRILDNKNNKYSNEKSPAGKTDYHTMGACYEVLRALRLKGDSA